MRMIVLISYPPISVTSGPSRLLMTTYALSGILIDYGGVTGFDVSGQRPVRRAEFAGDSLNAGT